MQVATQQDLIEQIFAQSMDTNIKIQETEQRVLRRRGEGEAFYLPSDEPAMHAVHAIQLEMLLTIDALCRKHNIHYYLVFGTLLGAIRHGGFIPWDDDVDIAIVREDFDRFMNLVKSELHGERYCLQYGGLDPRIPIPYAKLRARQTKFMENGRGYPDGESGIFIDIFTLDNVPDNAVMRNIQKFSFFSTHFPRRVKYDGYKTRFKFLQKYYDHKAKADPKVLWSKNMRAMTKFGDNQSKQLIAFPAARSDYADAYFLRSDIEPVAEIDFCGHKLMAPAAYESILTKGYGDYRCLPPVTYRRGHYLAYMEINLTFWSEAIRKHLPPVMEQYQTTINKLSEFKSL